MEMIITELDENIEINENKKSITPPQPTSTNIQLPDNSDIRLSHFYNSNSDESEHNVDKEDKPQQPQQQPQPQQQQQPQQPQQQPQQYQKSISDIVAKFVNENNPKILIGTPCYGGLLTTGYVQALCELCIKFTQLGINFEIIHIGNESLIPRARNGIVAKFLSDETLTHLMFIDADITFNWQSVLRMLLFNKEVVCGCYPKKTMNWDKIKHNLNQNPNIDNIKLLAKSLDYVFNPEYKEVNGQLIAETVGSFVKVKDSGTGFMMIKKETFTSLMWRYPEMKYRNNVAGYHNKDVAEFFYAFFDTGIDEEARVYLSEDYYFCKLWKKCGGDIWLDLDTNLNHTGNMDFRGCLMLSVNQVDNLNADIKYAEGSMRT